MTDNQVQAGRAFARELITGVILFAGVAAFYAHAVRYEFIYDDYRLIVNAPAPGSLGDFVGAFAEGHWEGLPYYRPVCRLTMVIQRSLHGLSPAPYHGLNALLMGVLAVVTWRLFRQPALAIRSGPALFGAVLVAVHPVASCTVYPICSGRETLMMAIFVVAAVTAFLKPGRLWYGLAMGMFALSLLCKEQAVIVPGLFVLADLLGLSPAAPKGEVCAWLRRYLAVGLILLAYLLLRWLLFHGSGQHRLAVLDRPEGPLLSFLYALQVTFTPFVQLVYEPSVGAWISEWRAIVCLLVVGGTWFLTKHYWPGARKLVRFWLGWFVLALLPTANLLGQEASFAERYVLLSLVAVVGLAVMLASLQWEGFSARRVLAGCALLLLGVCGWISWQRGQYFSDAIRFHTQWVRMDPTSDRAQWNLGWALFEGGRSEEAIVHLEESIRLNPMGADAYNNLGAIYLRGGDPAKALPYFATAVRLEPDHAQAHNNLAMVLGPLGNVDEAIKHFETALRINPNYSEAHNNLGVVLARQNELDRAARHFEQALQLNPDNAQAHNNLGNVFELQGERARAVAHYRSALQIDPNYTTARERLQRLEEIMGQRGRDIQVP